MINIVMVIRWRIITRIISAAVDVVAAMVDARSHRASAQYLYPRPLQGRRCRTHTKPPTLEGGGGRLRLMRSRGDKGDCDEGAEAAAVAPWGADGDGRRDG